MNAAEIILLILGFASISVSFFVGNRREDNDGAGGAAEENASRDIWTEKEEELVREQIAGIMKEEKEQVIAETTESLNRKSNEKIMEFDEFSSQILEKINRNHEEVVFMYNMLNEKEKEIAGIVTEPPKAASGTGTEPSGAAARETSKAGSGAGPAPRGTGNAAQGAPRVVQNAGPNRAQGQPAATAAVPVKQEEGKKSEPAATATDSSLMEGVSGDTILRVCKMYKEGKSVLEISKELGIGQGEVQLVITLYGGRRR